MEPGQTKRLLVEKGISSTLVFESRVIGTSQLPTVNSVPSATW